MSGSSDPPDILAPTPDCWRTIGVSGDRSCPELDQVIHCRNCPVLAEAARTFFDRAAPEGYLDSWRQLLEQPEPQADALATSVLIFRIGVEWFALPTTALTEIAAPRRLHRLPHRTEGILRGLVNIRGQIQLCLNLAALLDITDLNAASTDAGADASAPRLVVVEHGDERWVFEVDAVAGVHRVSQAGARPVPSTVSAGASR